MNLALKCLLKATLDPLRFAAFQAIKRQRSVNHVAGTPSLCSAALYRCADDPSAAINRCMKTHKPAAKLPAAFVSLLQRAADVKKGQKPKSIILNDVEQINKLVL